MESKKGESANIEELKEKSRNYSIKDGLFSTIKDSILGNYITPFAIAINSPDYMIGLLSSIPGLLGPISEWRSSRLIGKHTRKKIILKSVFFEILTYIPLTLTALLFYYGIITSFLPMILLIAFSLYTITANAGSPAWFSLIGDLVDEDKRGRWFGKRTAIFSVITIFSALIGAALLDFLKSKDLAIFGFALLFLIAMIARIFSRYYLSKHHEPEIKIEKDHYFSFATFIKKAPFNNFGRFAIFRALLTGAQYIAGSFFTVYMLKDLHFSYITLIIVNISATVFTLLCINWWGKFSDKYGNYQVLKITVILIGLCPITWLFNKNPIYLILVPQLLSGIGWGGFNLAASNYIFDCVTPQKRGLALSYADLLNGIGVFIGGLIGAILVVTIKTNLMNVLLIIFLISGICRLAVGFIMLPRIKEVKQKEKFHGREKLKSILKGKIDLFDF
ncbi:Multidrug resistance protein MdtG [uncultured archaeon]|nr:Multidrug resistance protein MdtG [uncultured archaeon]